MDALPLLPLRDCALLPGCSQELFVGRPATIAMLDSLNGSHLIACTQRSSAAAYPRRLTQLHPFACLAQLERRWTTPGGQQKVSIRGLHRVRVLALQPRLLQTWARTDLSPASLSEDAVEAALHTYEEQRRRLDLPVDVAPFEAVYRLSQVLGDSKSSPLVLDADDLDGVLAEVLNSVDRMRGAAWLH